MCYKARYTPNNMALIVAGDFDVPEMREKAEKWFGRSERKAMPSIFLPSEPVQLAERSQNLYEDVQITRVALGFHTPGIAHADTPILDALSVALGNGDSSFLYQKLREEAQLVHQIDASNWTPGEMGVFYISMVCDPDKKDAALGELKRVIENLQQSDFTQEIVDKVSRQLLVAQDGERAGCSARIG